LECVLSPLSVAFRTLPARLLFMCVPMGDGNWRVGDFSRPSRLDGTQIRRPSGPGRFSVAARRRLGVVEGSFTCFCHWMDVVAYQDRPVSVKIRQVTNTTAN
jgi:hypothetical protein